jgi:hypothetical protein
LIGAGGGGSGGGGVGMDGLGGAERWSGKRTDVKPDTRKIDRVCEQEKIGDLVIDRTAGEPHLSLRRQTL